MADYQEVTTRSYGQRLGSSFSGIGMGIVLFLAGTVLLWWNEGNFVQTRDALNEGQGLTQELGDINSVDPGANGKLVHATGMADTQEVLKDTVFGVGERAIRLERRVEYYQWIEQSRSETRQKLGGGEETVTTYSYSQGWTASPQNSQNFRDPQARINHANLLLMEVKAEKVQARQVSFGAYTLPEFLVSSIGGAQPLNVQLTPEAKERVTRTVLRTYPQLMNAQQGPGIWGATLAPPSVDSIPAARLPQLVHVQGDTIYIGRSPVTPEVGDLRVTFKVIPPAQVSILAQVNGNTFQSYMTKNGKSVSGLSMGAVSMEEMYQGKHEGNALMTWICRALGAFLIVAGLKTVTAPLSVLVSVIPALGSIVGAGTGLVSTLLGLAWSLLVISIAWLRFRPLIGGLMVAIAVALIVILFVRGRAAKAGLPPGGPVPPQEPPPPPQPLA